MVKLLDLVSMEDLKVIQLQMSINLGKIFNKQQQTISVQAALLEPSKTQSLAQSKLAMLLA